jgi:hypothetical protein
MQKPKKLPSKSQIRAELDAKVLKFMRSAPGMQRVPAVAKALGVPVSAANVSLRRLLSGGDLIRSERNKMGNDGHVHGRVPIYKAQPVAVAPEGPDWMSPKVPDFPAASVIGRRVFVSGRRVAPRE